MAKATLSAPESILRVLKRGPKRGLTSTTISERSGVKLSTTRSTLYDLQVAGNVRVIGREEPSFGRPANLYAAA